MPVFEYGETEINALKARDAKLGSAIDQIGLIRLYPAQFGVRRPQFAKRLSRAQ